MAAWLGVSVFLVALDGGVALGQSRPAAGPPRGPSAQDVANAKTMVRGTESAQWWTSLFVVAVVVWFAVSLRGSLRSVSTPSRTTADPNDLSAYEHLMRPEPPALPGGQPAANPTDSAPPFNDEPRPPQAS
jgi:hypothetical protein